MNLKQLVAPSYNLASVQDRFSRRKWLSHLILVSTYGVGVYAFRLPVGQAMESAAGTPVEASFRVRSVLELSGEVRLKNQSSGLERRNGKQLVARTAPVTSTSTLDYDEQYRIGLGEPNDRCVQYFHEASSQITVDKNVTKTTLRETSREVVKLGSPSGILTTAPAHPLTAAERDLVDGSLTTMYLDQLLTDAEVQVGDKWNVESESACRLLNLDAIQDGKLTVCLVDVNDTKAHLAIEGTLSASVRDVATELVIEGKGIMDRKGGFVSWLAMRIEETREIGEAEPGFKVVATMRVLRAPIDSMTSGRTLAQALKDVPSLESASMVQFQSEHGFYRFLADRRWSTYRDNGEEATLRFIVNNRRVAQCNLTNLVDLEPGRQLSLEGFQSDIQRMTSSSGQEILEAAERLSGTSHRILRVVASGDVEGIPIRWIYFHISNDAGRRMSMTFTLDEASVELFADQDQQLAGSLELLAWPGKLDAKSLDNADESEANSASADTTKESSEASAQKAASTALPSSRKR